MAGLFIRERHADCIAKTCVMHISHAELSCRLRVVLRENAWSSGCIFASAGGGVN